jgi:hypothetical protein
MTLLSDWGMTRMVIELTPEVNRAFSAYTFWVARSPGALPQACDECRALGAGNWCEFVDEAHRISQIQGKGRRGEGASRAASEFQIRVSDPARESPNFLANWRR